MNFYTFLLEKNAILTISLTAWLTAQVLKTIINCILMKKFQAERLWGAGGMPSSHSALVCSMTIAAGRSLGFSSPVFAIAVVMALIVMYDAMGVRRAACEQAKVLNQIIFDWMDANPALFSNEKQNKQLKEMLGHTPTEVLSGALLGIFFGFVIPLA